jgi:hypothetical protein
MVNEHKIVGVPIITPTYGSQTVILLIGIIIFAIQSGCIYLPAARDDLSVLGNDVFSNLIRESYSEKMTADKATGAGGSLGPSRIDREKANKITQELMLGKSVQKIIDLFFVEGGQCSTLIMEKEQQMNCYVVRKWKLKNIGAPFDTSNWSDPAAKLVFRFSVSEFNTIKEVNLEIIDVTEYKIIYTK